jgi:NAD-dependent deacetylase
MICEAQSKEGRERFAALVGEARCLVPFTGAGLSTDAGIPDFRSPGGLWTKNKPIGFEDFLASAEARREAWRRRFAMEEVFGGAEPTSGHRAVASWVREGRAPAVITQNIDNLHQDSGLDEDEVVEIHGNTTFATCLVCGLRHELSWIRPRFEASGEPPGCRACDGILKTATISFGQAMPAEAMRRAMNLAGRCDLFVALGTSLVVQPAASLPLMAKKAGASLVILNREATPLDNVADLVLRGCIAPVLSRPDASNCQG